jgi:hypothetical protein
VIVRSVIIAVALAALFVTSTAEAGPTLVRRGITRRPVAVKQQVILQQRVVHGHPQAFILQQQQPCYVPGSQSILLFQR